MSRQIPDFPPDWDLRVPPICAGPSPLRLRAELLPARSYFGRHSHPWHQFAHAVEGVLTVSTPQARHVITPMQGIWLPAGVTHSIGTAAGASFRSLYVTPEAMTGPITPQQVRIVSPLLRCLVLELAMLEGSAGPGDAGYTAQVVALALMQLSRAESAPNSVPWPSDPGLRRVGETLLADPGDSRPLPQWARLAGLSERTFLRRFRDETGLSYREWRARLRLLSALEVLNGGASVTATAHALGYSTPSAFVHMFHKIMGLPPQAYRQRLACDTRQF